jgi:hypothetical protein
MITIGFGSSLGYFHGVFNCNIWYILDSNQIFNEIPKLPDPESETEH